MDIDKATIQITDSIYKFYGSETGYLFGIEPKHKKAVESIVNLAIKWFIDIEGKEVNNAINPNETWKQILDVLHRTMVMVEEKIMDEEVK